VLLNAVLYDLRAVADLTEVPVGSLYDREKGGRTALPFIYR
jgi:hypothetical protein